MTWKNYHDLGRKQSRLQTKMNSVTLKFAKWIYEWPVVTSDWCLACIPGYI